MIFGALWRRSVIAIWRIQLYPHVALEQASVSCIPSFLASWIPGDRMQS